MPAAHTILLPESAPYAPLIPSVREDEYFCFTSVPPQLNQNRPGARSRVNDCFQDVFFKYEDLSILQYKCQSEYDEYHQLKMYW